ncbi:hypothetical protein HPP92_025815 [Vanilla planifolia]|uniref:Uncharacterized protein n=1 Tax=Vanilla planifolia TaxID=51239 RepID=A0A835PJ45_VANPL|nr:hypothetical protein HPP92_025815 [Vanilla planifolia]
MHHQLRVDGSNGERPPGGRGIASDDSLSAGDLGLYSAGRSPMRQYRNSVGGLDSVDESGSVSRRGGGPSLGARSGRRVGFRVRMNTCLGLLDLRPTVIRGNASEILGLASACRFRDSKHPFLPARFGSCQISGSNQRRGRGSFRGRRLHNGWSYRRRRTERCGHAAEDHCNRLRRHRSDRRLRRRRTVGCFGGLSMRPFRLRSCGRAGHGVGRRTRVSPDEHDRCFALARRGELGLQGENIQCNVKICSSY